MKHLSAKLAVFYNQVQHKKINGTLFYCFEYFVYLNKHQKTLFYIANASDEDILNIKALFTDRYTFDKSILDNIIQVKNHIDIHELSSNLDRLLILDNRSAQDYSFVIKCDLLIYCNKVEKRPIKSDKKDITYFGWYDYQLQDVKEKLKLNFDIFKEIKETKTGSAYISAAKEYDKVLDNITVTENKIIVKEMSTSINGLFTKFDKLYYYHNGPDANNRLIPECFFYNKEVEVVETDLPRDSVYYRFIDCKENRVESYRLTDDDKIIRKMIGKDITT